MTYLGRQHQNRQLRSFIVVRGEKSTYDHGFSMGSEKDQRILRQSAIDVIMIQVVGRERKALQDQFVNLPYSKMDINGPLVYYGDMAKFISRHFILTILELPPNPNHDVLIAGM
jgi:hypothetical protein